MNFTVGINSIHFCSLHAVPLILHLDAVSTVVYITSVVAPVLIV